MRTLVTACLAAALVPLLPVRDRPVASTAQFPGWPEPFRGMRQLPLTERELRFAAGSGGTIGRFTGNGREYAVRWIPESSRRVHSAQECYRALGARITNRPIRLAALNGGTARFLAELRWGCFEAAHGKTTSEVCQTIVDANGRSWSDPGSWWWAALTGHTKPDWWAVVEQR